MSHNNAKEKFIGHPLTCTRLQFTYLSRSASARGGHRIVWDFPAPDCVITKVSSTSRNRKCWYKSEAKPSTVETILEYFPKFWPKGLLSAVQLCTSRLGEALKQQTGSWQSRVGLNIFRYIGWVDRYRIRSQNQDNSSASDTSRPGELWNNKLAAGKAE